MTKNTAAGLTRRGFLRLGGSAACALGLGAVLSVGGELLSPETAYATVEGDQTPLTEEEIEEAIRSGQIRTEFPESPVAALSSADYAIRTISGSDRYQTNAAQVLSAFSSSAWAIVAGGEGYADSICAAGLAGALSCPIVLTAPDELSPTAASTLTTIGARDVILLGGEAAVSARVEDDLNTLVGSGGTVTRLSGMTRYDTQMAVYEYGVEHDLWGDTAVVASATGFADALAVSPVSYKLKAPVFYVDETTYFPAEQEEAILSSGMTSFILVGGQSVMSSRVESTLRPLGSVTPLSGESRYETSRKIADYAVTLGMSLTGMAFTSGLAPYDALGGGPVQGAENSVIVLMDENDYHSAPSIPFSSKPSALKFFGGKNVYSCAFKTRFALAAGYSLTDIEGMKVYVDAGHGGSDPGAISGGYREADLTAELAQDIGNHLVSDYGLPAYVNTSGNNYKLRHPEAKAMDCGVLVSIHFNAGGGTGSESYIHSENSAAGSVALQNSTHTALVSALGLTDRGKKDDWLAVVSGPLPSVLLEICFIDTSSDMSTYQSRKGSVAEAIARGIAEA